MHRPSSEVSPKSLWALHLLAPLLLPLSLLSSFWLVRLRLAFPERRLLLLGLVVDVLIVLGYGATWTRWNAQDMAHSGQVEVASLGVELGAVAGDKGVVIERVHPTSAAALAGLSAHDRILTLQGKAPRSREELSGWIRSRPIGTEVELDVISATGQRRLKRVRLERKWVDDAGSLRFRRATQYVSLAVVLASVLFVGWRAYRMRASATWLMLFGGAATMVLPGVPGALAQRLVPRFDPSVGMLFGEGVLVVMSLWLWRRVDPRPAPALPPERDVPYTFGVGAAFTTSWLARCALLLSAIALRFDLNVAPTDSFAELLRPGSGWQRALVGAVVVLLGPLGEELLFRGALLGWLARFLAPWMAIGVSAALFMAAHASSHGGYLLYILVLGVAFGWMRLKSGSLHPSLMLHVAINAVAFLQMLREAR